MKKQHSDRLAMFLATVLLASPIAAPAECLAPLLVSPVSGATISETRPQLRFESPASQVTSAVRIRIDARVPEGREVARIEARLTLSDSRYTSFAVPRSLAGGERRTKVRVELVAECESGASAPASTWFAIDAASACVMPPAVVRRTASELGWSPARTANEYLVCSANVCRRVQTNRIATSDLPAGAGLIAITPICNDATGAARVIALE